MELKDIFRVLKKRMPVLIFLPIFAMVAGGIISFYFLTPIYKASTTLMVSKTYSGENGPILQYNDILTANELVNTYSELAKSRAVVKKVIELEKLKMTPAELSGKINVQPVRDTQLIQIAVEDPNPKLAASLANAAGQVFMEKVTEIMEMDNVSIVDRASLPQNTEKPNKILNILIAGIVGFMAAVGLVFLLEYLDQTIKTKEDIDNYLGLTVLGTIPKIDN